MSRDNLSTCRPRATALRDQHTAIREDADAIGQKRSKLYRKADKARKEGRPDRAIALCLEAGLLRPGQDAAIADAAVIWNEIVQAERLGQACRGACPAMRGRDMTTNEQHPCPGAWNWWASYDGGENYVVGPKPSRDAIILAVFDDDRCGEYQNEHGEWRIQALICEAQNGNVDLARYFDVEDFLDRAADRMDENDYGDDENGEDHPIEEITPELASDLESSVRAAIRDWQKRNALPLRSYWFQNFRNQEHIDLPHPELF